MNRISCCTFRSKLLLTVVLSFCAFVFSHVQASEIKPAPNPSETLLKQVQEAVKNKDYLHAEQICLKFIQQSPDSVVAARRELAIVYIHSANVQAVEAQIEIIKNDFSANADTPEALFLIAKQWTLAEQPEKALQLHAYNAETYPHTHSGMISQVKIIKADFQQKNYSTVQSGIAILIQRFAEQPGLPLELYKLGRQYADVGQPEQAKALYQYTIDHPVSEEYAMKSRMGIFELEAVDDKNSAWVRNELNLIKGAFADQDGLPKELWATAAYFRKKAHSGLAFQIDQYAAEQFSGTQYGMLSHAESVYYQIHKKQYDEAEASCWAFVERYGQDSGFLKQAINIIGQYDKRGLLTKAEFLCNLAFQAQPEHKDAIVLKKHLIRTLLDQDDLERATTSLREFMSSYQSHPSYFREAYGLGWDFQEHQDYTTALAVYDQLLSHFPNNKEIGRIPYYQARAYLESGQIDKSLECVEACFTTYSNWKPMARKMLKIGCMYGRLGNADSGRQILTRVLNEHTKELVGSDMAMAYVHLGEDGKVQEQINEILESDRSLSKKHQFMLEIAQEYRHISEQAQKRGVEERKNQSLQKEIAILNNVVEADKSRHSAEATYCIAIAYHRLEEYQQAGVYFDKLVHDWPSDKRRWHALVLLAECYDILAHQNKIPFSQADRKVRAIYSEILKKYPDIPEAKTTSYRLDAQ